jgi:hypothetical protein
MHYKTEEENSYWLLNWLESRHIKSVSDAAAILSKPSILRELRLVAEQWSHNATILPSALNLVAGAGLKLNGPLSCSSSVCRRRQVDVLFRHAWHYFDKVLLPDGVGSLLLDPPDGLGSEDMQSAILRMIEITLHIQNLGASRLVNYYPTIHGTCGHAEASRLDQPTRWDEAWESVENSILTEADFSIKQIEEETFSIEIDSPQYEIRPGVDICLSKDEPRNKDYIKSIAAHRVASDYMYALEEDMKVAHLLQGPLASTLWSHQRAISILSESPDPAGVAFQVSFPTLENVPINELIAIRETNADAFVAFRDAIMKAVKEMSANCKSPDYERLANQIKLEVIDPEIARLNDRLRTAKNALAYKAATTIALSAVGTLCASSLGFIPGAIVGTLSTASAISNLTKDSSKYIDDKREIQLSDMYFAWKALKHAE